MTLPISAAQELYKMFSKYFKTGGVATTVMGFAITDNDSSEGYSEPIDITFSMGEAASKVLISMNLDDAKALSRAIGGAITHVENEAAEAALMAPFREQT